MASFQFSQVTLLFWAHMKTGEWNVYLQIIFPSQSWRLSERAAHHSIEFNEGWIIVKCHFLLISLSLRVIHPLSLMLVIWGECSGSWNGMSFCYYVIPNSFVSSKITTHHLRVQLKLHTLKNLLLTGYMICEFFSYWFLYSQSLYQFQ